MCIRHGEKPGEGGPPHGVDPQGEKAHVSLSPRGWARAGALAGLFGHLPLDAYPSVVRPERVIATKPTHHAHSHRERETGAVIAERLGFEVDESFTHGDEAKVARAVLVDPRSALVVWHHGTTPKLVRHFPLSAPDAVPHSWPDRRFDLLWVLSWNEDEAAYDFAEVNQCLLSGDRPPGQAASRNEVIESDPMA